MHTLLRCTALVVSRYLLKGLPRPAVTLPACSSVALRHNYTAHRLGGSAAMCAVPGQPVLCSSLLQGSAGTC